MSFEGINTNNEFKSGYEDLGPELTKLEQEFGKRHPSRDVLGRFNPDNISNIHLQTTHKYLSKFLNDPEVGDLILSLNSQIEKIMFLNKDGIKKSRLATMRAANDDTGLKRAA